MLLRGIDMAIMQVDVLDYARQQNFTPSIEHSITYVTRLYNGEFHLLARQTLGKSRTWPTKKLIPICAAPAPRLRLPGSLIF